MDLLEVVTPAGWLRLGLALVLFAGPGFALGELLRGDRRLDLTQVAAVALPASLALWAVILAWLDLVKVSLARPAVWLLLAAGWLLYAALRWRRRGDAAPAPRAQGAMLATALLWLAVATTALVSVWALRGVAVQPGSDGYHHTLIAQAIVDQGGLPEDLLPLTSLVSFSYHFGYHGFVAAVHWLTGIAVVALVPLLAQLLKATAALSVAFLVEAMGGRRGGSAVAATLVGLVAVFPAYYVNWGRNTQLTGLLIMAVLLGILWQWSEGRPTWPAVFFTGLLAAGIALVHYRVTLMAGLGAALVVAGAGAVRWPRGAWRLRLLQLAAMVATAALLVAPWVWHIFQARTVGYPAPIDTPQTAFFQLSRLGDLVLGYATNWPVLLLLALAVLWGGWRRLRGVLVMAAWLAALFLLSLPGALGQYMDTITVLQSLWVPAAAIVGMAAGDFMAPAGTPVRWRSWAVAVPTLLLAIAGARSVASIVEPGAPYVLPADLPAAAWVQSNVPADAHFMVNTFRFDFMPDYVIGGDAGSWLPVLARRSVVTAPMNYPVERNRWPDYEARVNALADLGGDLSTPAALALLRQEGVTHVYLGARGGQLQAEPLLTSPDFTLLYHEGPVYIFAVNPHREG